LKRGLFVNGTEDISEESREVGVCLDVGGCDWDVVGGGHGCGCGELEVYEGGCSDKDLDGLRLAVD
jgi:hypothetical protein